MTLLVLLLPVLLGAVFASRGRRRAAGVCLLLALLAFLAVGCGWVPRLLLGHLQRGYADDFSDWGKRNAIVMLGAGTQRGEDGRVMPGLFANGRMLRTAMLYRTCKASGADCRVEVSGGDAMRNGTPESVLYSRWLGELGVPASDFLREPRSMNTWQNAEFSAPLLRGYGADRVLLVSSASHLRRAGLYFDHFGIHTVPVRADELVAPLSWKPLAWNLALTDLAAHEYAGIVRFHVYQAMGWNAASGKAGAL
jgi:uncharacterized SAM-binding protein YcdF (DUF218 family)